MDVVQDEKDIAAVNKLANKDSKLLKPNQLAKPNFTSSSPMGVRNNGSNQNVLSNNSYHLGSNLASGGDKGLNRNESFTSVGSAQAKKVQDNFVAP